MEEGLEGMHYQSDIAFCTCDALQLRKRFDFGIFRHNENEGVKLGSEKTVWEWRDESMAIRSRVRDAKIFEV